MRRPRFTVRQVMLTVLLAAVILGAFEAGRRWEREHTPWGAVFTEYVEDMNVTTGTITEHVEDMNVTTGTIMEYALPAQPPASNPR